MTLNSQVNGPGVVLAAFGKHPGWDDHIDDIHVDTAPLVAFKRLLYFEGLAGNIDSGRWEQLNERQRLAGFRHSFVHQRRGRLLLGRLWSSRDGKGRSKYPMVLCADCSGLSIPWALDVVMPRLAEVENRCREAASAQEVIRVMTEANRSLRELVDQAGESRRALPAWLSESSAVFAEAAEQIEPRESHQGFCRLAYKIERDLAAYKAGGRVKAPIPQHLRMPAGAASLERSLAVWTGVILSFVAPSTPLTLFRPEEASWLDVLVGEPRTQEFFCLLASPETLPLATEIPYKIDPDLTARYDRMLIEWRQKRMDGDDVFSRVLAEGADEAGGSLARRCWGTVKGLMGSRRHADRSNGGVIGHV